MKMDKKLKMKGKVLKKKRLSQEDDNSCSLHNDHPCSDSDSSSSSDSEGSGLGSTPRKKARTAGKGAPATAVTVAAPPSAHPNPVRVPASEFPRPTTVGINGASTAPANAADKAAAKRAHADAVMARLTAKLEAATDPKKRLALQAKMLRVLPKCTPQPTTPAPQPAPHPTAPATGASVGRAPVGGGAAFQFKLQRTPKAALMPARGTGLTGPEEEARRRRRQQRFGDASGQADGEQSEAALVDAGGLGTCEALEKEYLRLTSLPRAADVRPPAVLGAALRLVKAKWVQSPDYAAASEQLKAIRQDLTVQHVRDALTVDVYETHGRLALEADDFAEFRRCHAVLRQLYREGLPGNPAEFEAYGLLYTQATAAARSTLALELGRVPEPLLGHPFVRHALEVCVAARSGNYSRFVALYDGAPRMSPYIMDRLLGKMRLLALQSSVVAYKPLPVPLEHLALQMGLETEEEAAALAAQLGAVVDPAGRCLDTRASAAQPLGPPRPADGPS